MSSSSVSWFTFKCCPKEKREFPKTGFEPRPSTPKVYAKECKPTEVTRKTSSQLPWHNKTMGSF